MNWEMVIGLEVHIQLNTKSKLFSSSATKYGQHQNSQASFLDLGLPGTLPVVNKEAIRKAIIFGLAVDAKISKDSFFARKNYFYPDLPKGYQISQSNNPIVQDGKLDIQTSKGDKVIRIERAHIEEDAGKSIHGYVAGETGLDYNRAGTPLLEIVTYPDFRSAEEVVVYLKKLHQLVKHLNICDGNMQEGSFRCDVNLSIRPQGQAEFGTRAELKNINSFRFIDKAIEYEYARQVAVLESGGLVIQETRLYDADANETRSMRAKEDAFDYRYFPDPDLLPLKITDEYIEEIKSQMPLKPEQREELYRKHLGDQEVEFLLSNLELADYYDQLVKKFDYKLAYNWLTVDLISTLNRLEKEFDADILPPDVLSQIIESVQKDIISQKSARQVMFSYVENPKDIDKIIEELGLKQVSDEGALRKLVQDIIKANPEQATDFKAGKTKLMSFFIGLAMKASKGKANPKQVNQIVQEELNK
ncbi:Asp-tRNA(Asn)/Glu-tRNA(Gln) amidotransferase subunit GatB [Allofrancisella guangzhouensis]|uniref:Aspartyl/glutamyl-tRNA(Asn/Gln) amidotransferase subunit B n=1 Tax=Allofrancisella guangzhouensis TaxID=594679 RepID=A0A0A8E4F3_9GAMM|nr:Asp-tRNA(Asn)/Glu-tRNA(Gln) amidotransferase subunit GatB [Allofrancisella guangzhouensis]AJC48482.1 glutamyl-tRNA amidotransferase [Allofrancisella guangzhouensis]MBK2027614.1 Asp-tRNA(Asn)/Glu-tRNA(Gln) amidotransferase subunit GatB [Allofrancisella guangzhouensis]MBK2044073.1 Asp-tRNA(Asn)/Glu-tRNA(Gln) amidotransferase subunit GatB [Allofrancisella guangzhouensis]MBK2046521.1 Asp-tRNA(Asn)/Glu-tRNA(Gln) amidotransferase subunit GatB [Allofrancisella guangzhouensis]